MTVKFYLFNITNKDQVLAGSERPKFEEIGPFVFKQWRRRDIVDFEDYNRRIKYREYKTFYPVHDFKPKLKQHNEETSDSYYLKGQVEPEMTEKHNDVPQLERKYNTSAKNDVIDSDKQSAKFRQLNDVLLDPYKTKVTLINIPLLTALTKLASLEEGTLKRTLAAKIAARLIEDSQDKILVTKSVNEILFDGYRVDFLESVRDLISGTFSLNFEPPLPNNKFGFFYLKNNTWNKRENGELTVYSGRNKSMDDFMQVESWNDLRELSVWPNNTVAGNRCNQIRGTDGSQFHPGVKRTQVLSVFSPQVCTSLYIKYKEDTEVRGIQLFRFTTPGELFAAPKKTAKNACYCTIASPSGSSGSESTETRLTSTGGQVDQLQQQQQQKKGKAERSSGQQSTITDSRCYWDGLMDLSLCQRGAPVAASSPHFYNADPMLALAAGLKPNKELHETYIDIEPMTGAVLRAASRVQLNAYVERAALDVVDAGVVGRMSDMVAPLLWLEESAEVDEKTADELKRQLFNTVVKVRRSCVYAIALGLLLGCASFAHFWYFTCYKTELDAGARQARPRAQVSVAKRRTRSSRQRDEPLLSPAETRERPTRRGRGGGGAATPARPDEEAGASRQARVVVAM